MSDLAQYIQLGGGFVIALFMVLWLTRFVERLHDGYRKDAIQTNLTFTASLDRIVAKHGEHLDKLAKELERHTTMSTDR